MRTHSMNTIHLPRQGGRKAAASCAFAALASLTVGSSAAFGQDAAPANAPPPGLPLPKGLDWKFNFDATLGGFGFANSLYTNPKPEEPSGDLSDNWFEGSLKPALTGVYTTSSTAQFYGKLSAVGERTYGAAPSLVGSDESSFGLEDMYVGWRSGDSLDLGKDALDFTIGRAPYSIGHQMLLGDGSAEGGSRGGYWTNARKAFEWAAIGRLKTGNHLVEGFYLDKDDLPEANSSTKLWGANYQYAIGEDTTLGATYMKFSADPARAPQRDGLSVYNARAYTAPFSRLKGLSFEAEYALEDNGNALDSTAWNFLAAYQLEGGWQPKISYRYAIFEGDNPATTKNEAFDGLLTGFYDWGTWWQGEIAGEYFVSNSNLISHQLRVHLKPKESVGMGFILYDFLLDKPASAGVTSNSVAKELDWYMDWSFNSNFTVSFVLAYADPGAAVQQSSGRTDSFLYGMVFAAYKY
jgi:Alginate export